MKISPVGFGYNAKNVVFGTAKGCDGYIPATQRENSLANIEFNIVADTIRCQNLKNQMSVRLMGLRHRLNNCMAQDFYSQDN